MSDIVTEILGLERQLNGQLVPKNFEDFQSDWASTIEALNQFYYNKMVEIIDSQARLHFKAGDVITPKNVREQYLHEFQGAKKFAEELRAAAKRELL
jgi:hypothetical protein